MTQHPALVLAAQTAGSARDLARHLDPMRDALYPDRRWPRPLTTAERTELLVQVRAAFADIGICVLGIAAGVAAASCPDTALRASLFDATHLIGQALTRMHDTLTAPHFPVPRQPE